MLVRSPDSIRKRSLSSDRNYAPKQQHKRTSILIKTFDTETGEAMGIERTTTSTASSSLKRRNTTKNYSYRPPNAMDRQKNTDVKIIRRSNTDGAQSASTKKSVAITPLADSLTIPRTIIVKSKSDDEKRTQIALDWSLNDLPNEILKVLGLRSKNLYGTGSCKLFPRNVTNVAVSDAVSEDGDDTNLLRRGYTMTRGKRDSKICQDQTQADSRVHGDTNARELFTAEENLALASDSILPVRTRIQLLQKIIKICLKIGANEIGVSDSVSQRYARSLEQMKLNIKDVESQRLEEQRHYLRKVKDFKDTCSSMEAVISILQSRNTELQQSLLILNRQAQERNNANDSHANVTGGNGAVLASKSKENHINANDVKFMSSILKLDSQHSSETNTPEPHSSIVCPITYEVFEDPVVASDGHTYEKAAILEWVKNKGTSPLTGAPLEKMTFYPNQSIKSLARDWKAFERFRMMQLKEAETSIATSTGSTACITSSVTSTVSRISKTKAGSPSWTKSYHQPFIQLQSQSANDIIVGRDPKKCTIS